MSQWDAAGVQWGAGGRTVRPGAVACVGERLCPGFAGLSVWPCPGAVLGHGWINLGMEEG